MIGWVYVMEPKDYQKWLSGGASEARLSENGKKLFEQLACSKTAKVRPLRRGPTWSGSSARGENSPGRNVKADESYHRESILQPQAKIVSGFEARFPTSGPGK